MLRICALKVPIIFLCLLPCRWLFRDILFPVTLKASCLYESGRCVFPFFPFIESTLFSYEALIPWGSTISVCIPFRFVLSFFSIVLIAVSQQPSAYALLLGF